MKYALLAVGTFAVTAGSMGLSTGTGGAGWTAVLAIVFGLMCVVGSFVQEALDDNRKQQRLADDDAAGENHQRTAQPRHAST